MGTRGIWVSSEGVAETKCGAGGDHSANRERGRGDGTERSAEDKARAVSGQGGVHVSTVAQASG